MHACRVLIDGFISEIHAMGAQLSNCWEIVAGALSDEIQ
jgi:hypothetical protein